MAFDQKQYLKEYNIKHNERLRAQKKVYYYANREKLLEQTKKTRAIHGKRYNANRLNKHHGLKPGDYESMLAAQNNSCAICKSTNPKQYNSDRFNIDHNHKTGKVRGLLCSPCNRSIGLLKDEPGVLMMAAMYIIETSHK